MKRTILTAIASFSLFQGLFAQTSDPVAFLINGEEVTKSEFEYIYRKNNSNKAVEKKTLEEYVDLFVKFKLKVAQAKDLWYDHSKNFLKEYEQYENQLTFPYLRDSLLAEKLLQEAYERSAYKVNASHILISVAPDSQDTSAAYAKINDIYAQLKSGASFEDLAKSNSDCPSKKDGGNIGEITVFNTVYPFETKAYNTPVGSFSAPFRTRFGFHIVKVNSRERIIKDVKFSHIALGSSGEATDKQAEKICKQLKKGKLTFADAARKYSTDISSIENGGDLGYLSQAGPLPTDYVMKVKSIGKVGTYEVVKSAFGTFVVTVTDIVSVPDFETVKEDLRTQMSRSDRGENSVNDVIARLKVQNNLKIYQENLQPFCHYASLDGKDDEATKASRDSIRRLLTEPLFEYAGNVHAQSEFFPEFLKAVNTHYPEKDVDRNEDAKKLVDLTFSDYIQHYVWNTELDRLKRENPEYRHLLNEYRDGLLLFEISSKKVWTKAAKDREGLEKFFSENKSKYAWKEPKFKGAVVRCASQADMDAVNKFIANYGAVSTVKGKKKVQVQPQPIPYDSIQVVLEREFNKDGEKVVKVTKGLFSKGANPDVDALAFGEKKSESETKNPYPYVTTIGKLISAPENFSDVRGPLTADYQVYLEEQWVEDLKNRYPVVKYQAVINSIEE